MNENNTIAYAKVTLDYAPKENGEDFDKWCEKYGFTPLGSGRRAWCGDINTYFRGASGVATTPSGDIFLFDHKDIVFIAFDEASNVTDEQWEKMAGAKTVPSTETEKPASH